MFKYKKTITFENFCRLLHKLKWYLGLKKKAQQTHKS